MRRKDEVSKILESVDPGSDLLLAVVESYKQANSSEIRRQLLSLVASKVTCAALVAHIPRLTRYEFSAARRYVLEVDAGIPVQPVAKRTREKVDSVKLDHFLDFITSSNIVQDLPFGRKTLTLSCGTKIDIPNVIRTLLPSRLIKQYNQYCSEENYAPLSTRTLFRISSEACVASVRKSLQGLDSYAAEGGRDFDDLLSLLDITESRPLKHVGRKKWGTQDALRAHKGLPPFSVPFDFKTRTPKRESFSALSRQ